VRVAPAHPKIVLVVFKDNEVSGVHIALFLSSLPVENSLQGPEHGLQPCCPAQYQAPQSI
jgi:hypothetical protein